MRRSPLPFSLARADSVAWLRTLEANSIDLFITDPPYESLERYRAIGTTTRLKHSKGSSNDWFAIFPNSRFGELFHEFHRVLRNNRHLYVFCDHATLAAAQAAGEAAGFRFWKPLVWDKKKIGMGYHYRCRYEFILFFEKGKRKLRDLSVPDVLEAPRVNNGYPTEKPVSLIGTLVKQSALPGELVCDPFMGSGSAGVAALANSCRFSGCDISEKALALAQERLASAVGSARMGAA